MIHFFFLLDITIASGRLPRLILHDPTQPPAPPHAGRGLVYRLGMGGWFWLIALGLFLVLIGLYLHWSVVLLGALLPFIPVVAELLRRRNQPPRNREP